MKSDFVLNTIPFGIMAESRLLVVLLSLSFLTWIVASAASPNQSITFSDACLCTNGVANCSNRHLQNHLEDLHWDQVDFAEVTFDYNNIVHLRKFPSTRIGKLSFRHNGITEIDNAAFRDVANLMELDLSHNHLTTHEFRGEIFRGNYSKEGGFEPLESLRILKLSGNALHSLDSDVFEHLPNLEMLSLDSNPLKIIDHQSIIAIGSLHQLSVLDLSSTLLSQMPPSLLYTLNKLTVLNLSDNLFTVIPPELAESQSLDKLILSNNPIVEINSSPLVPSLRVLEMNFMPNLGSIGNGGLNGFTGLEALLCSYNHNLREIHVSALSSWAPGSGPFWPPVKRLLLQSNKLRYLEQEFLGRWDTLEEIDLSLNPWVCDCNSQWFVDVLIPVISSVEASQADKLICFEPIELRGIHLSDLSAQGSHMRCLDKYNHRPERDSVVLIIVVAGLLSTILFIMAGLNIYRRHYEHRYAWSKVAYQKSPSLETIS